MPKPEREFTSVEAFPWMPVEGYPAGVYERTLSVDEATGCVTRLVRFDPGVETMGILAHDFREEVYILEAHSSTETTCSPRVCTPVAPRE